MFALYFFLPRLVFLVPPQLVNMPNKAYWLSAEMKATTMTKLTTLCSEFGIAIMALFFCVTLLLIEANMLDVSNPGGPARQNMPAFLGALVLFLLFTLYWSVKAYWVFRLPKGGEESESE